MKAAFGEADYATAAQYLAEADALLIGAGAGMGVDSGLPTFRGDTGFWQAYPALQGRSFAEIATPDTFTHDPELAWGFYGHRLNLYRQYAPHARFAILRRWMATLARPPGAFVMTSNVDVMAISSGPVLIPNGCMKATARFIPCNATGAARTPGRPMRFRSRLIHKPAVPVRPCPAVRSAARWPGPIC